MLGLVAMRRDRMNIDIDGKPCAAAKKLENFQPGFLSRLAQRDLFDAGVPIGMAPELKPTLELAVVGEKHSTMIRRDDPCRTRYVPDTAAAFETILVGLDKRADPIRSFPVIGITLPIALEKMKQRFSMHGTLTATEFSSGSNREHSEALPNRSRPSQKIKTGITKTFSVSKVSQASCDKLLSDL